ncbi:MAG TPA: YetF domain-containing protein [Candidatus Limnocylindrales bacterium]|nr:YetF domain-containing protein [Candidatus Limnocylindrales bacterium]
MNIDLGKILLPDTPILEIFIRGTITYLALFLLLRFTRKRQAGGMGMTDLLVIVLIADASQNSMAGQYTSVIDGLLLVGTIVFWAFALDWLGYHIPAIERLVHPPPLTLIEDGRLNRGNMRLELMTLEELMTQLRAEGVESVEQVRRAYLEGNGRLSVLRKDGPTESESPAPVDLVT